ncbi:hypothetical protein SAMN05880558_103137 [Aeromonas sp. RU39B]|uniref:hypothetical protein n=1 Tax=Aeromonas sp. RU39B TaxID=1907416 RepID=UPI0009570689|nr:hypothetical protein [Aeromonas sp. RU39B]SIQ38883.1 hypothetical protein SAMN05880558_103137 [Aeromonas sp. RU39B]
MIVNGYSSAIYSAQPSSAAERQQSAAAYQQGTRFVLAEDKVTLGEGSSSSSDTYSRASVTRNSAEKKSLTDVAWEHLLAKRVGLSKEKLDQIEQKKQEIEGSQKLTAEQKQTLLDDLEKQREALIKEASERRREQGDEAQQSNVTG